MDDKAKQTLKDVLVALVDEISDLRLSARLLAAASPKQLSPAQADELKHQVRDIYGAKFDGLKKAIGTL